MMSNDDNVNVVCFRLIETVIIITVVMMIYIIA